MADTIASEYVSAINAADLEGLLALFSPDAVLTNPFGTFEGIEAIRGFYEGTVLAGQAKLSIRSTTTEGTAVRAELIATSPLGEPGNEMLAIDDFVIGGDGRITSLDIVYP